MELAHHLEANHAALRDEPISFDASDAGLFTVHCLSFFMLTSFDSKQTICWTQLLSVELPKQTSDTTRYSNFHHAAQTSKANRIESILRRRACSQTR
jgi:hypothetical protein